MSEETILSKKNEISRFIIDWGKLNDEYKERLV